MDKLGAADPNCSSFGSQVAPCGRELVKPSELTGETVDLSFLDRNLTAKNLVFPKEFILWREFVELLDVKASKYIQKLCINVQVLV